MVAGSEDDEILQSLRGWRSRLDKEIEEEERRALPQQLHVAVSFDSYLVQEMKINAPDFCAMVSHSFRVRLAEELEPKMSMQCRRIDRGFQISSTIYVFDRDGLDRFVKRIREEERAGV